MDSPIFIGFDCPLCDYQSHSLHQILYHMEEKHSEDGPSPFVVKDTSVDSDIAKLAVMVSQTELDLPSTRSIRSTSMDSSSDDNAHRGGKSDQFLIPENVIITPTVANLTPSPKRQAKPSGEHAELFRSVRKYDRNTRTRRAVKYVSIKKPGQLGVAELGQYAFEKEMPKEIRELLERDGQAEYRKVLVRGQKIMQRLQKYTPNWADGTIPVVKHLIEQDPTTAYAYFCSPKVTHIAKLHGEGSFCGYRNIQMLCSHVVKAKFEGHEALKGKVPSIFEIQDTIESAWDHGIFSHNRIETGGIRGTRKHIGTPEAQAFFTELNIPIVTGTWKGDDAATRLKFINAIKDYFSGQCADTTPKIRQTVAPPIYFQHRGHSMTIIGLEVKRDGSSNLLVFDPGYKAHDSVLDMIGKKVKLDGYNTMMELSPYRKGEKYLGRLDAFEVLMLSRHGTRRSS